MSTPVILKFRLRTSGIPNRRLTEKVFNVFPLTLTLASTLALLPQP